MFVQVCRTYDVAGIHKWQMFVQVFRTYDVAGIHKW
jgi:hypothetical protein